MRNIIQLLNTAQFKQALDGAEKEVYLAAYKYAGGNQSQAAKLLGVSRGKMIYMAKRFGFRRSVIATDLTPDGNRGMASGHMF